MAKNQKLIVKGTEITLFAQEETDFISLTDMTRSFKEGSGLIGKWITNKNTLEYLGTWEKINNPNFNYPEFVVIEQDAGVNRFIMSVGQWIQRTGAVSSAFKFRKYKCSNDSSRIESIRAFDSIEQNRHHPDEVFSQQY
jgi:hypothetical protein